MPLAPLSRIDVSEALTSYYQQLYPGTIRTAYDARQRRYFVSVLKFGVLIGIQRQEAQRIALSQQRRAV